MDSKAKNKQVITRQASINNLIEVGFGMFAGEISLLKSLLKTKKEEIENSIKKR